ncbi:N-acetylmuramoyl-L-alanine amidase [Croceivirga sp. JEA036]|uniref:N-acetylmuramoyl-L-alanine amidase family protein n=1 Tax=Croceivirga sp. JEA036 TaxID=2721162 RepID=UPI0014388318|nr:N-acetylmuramoyl-L-alanine amidase [Croceivirga sp. JEA036]NJB35350.1 N-acetylmuramoyl-L-alanine amidase [Croceivirga sp. JEA036]
MNRNRLVFTIVFGFVLLLFSFRKNNTEKQNDDKFIIVLDAGHGGHDPGNLGNGYLEKNIALDIVLETGRILSQHPDIKVIYTRKDDTFVNLYERGQIANRANADLFVSVHCDSHTSDAHGAGTFVLGLHANKQNFEVAKKENSVIYLEDNYEQTYDKYDINSPESVIGMTVMQEEFLEQSIALAKLLQDNFVNQLKRKDRKVKQAGFIVLHQTFMPSVLVETGFLTNKSEGAFLNSDKGKKLMGSAIAKAVLNYKNGVDSSLEEVTPIIEQPIEKANEEIVTSTKQPEVNEITPPKKEVVSTPKEPEAVVDQPKATEEVAVEGVTFKVQLMASSKVIPLKAENFKGLSELSKEPVKNMYRYMYGSTPSYLKAKLLKSNADAKGYTTSYIVAYKNGTRITMAEALKTVSKE